MKIINVYRYIDGWIDRQVFVLFLNIQKKRTFNHGVVTVPILFNFSTFFFVIWQKYFRISFNYLLISEKLEISKTTLLLAVFTTKNFKRLVRNGTKVKQNAQFKFENCTSLFTVFFLFYFSGVLKLISMKSCMTLWYVFPPRKE